jgi:hypothetical protein
MAAREFLEDAIRQFHGQKKLVERAIAQVPDSALWTRIDPESNSIAIVMKHIAGNQRSRWTDFLTSDGEKPDRHRDSEFEMDEGMSREKLLAIWEDGWRRVFAAVEPLTQEALDRTVAIRGEPHTVVRAINRQLTHYAYHAGQIVFLAKHFAGPAWKSLSIPKGQSEQYKARP